MEFFIDYQFVYFSLLFFSKLSAVDVKLLHMMKALLSKKLKLIFLSVALKTSTFLAGTVIICIYRFDQNPQNTHSVLHYSLLRISQTDSQLLVKFFVLLYHFTPV